MPAHLRLNLTHGVVFLLGLIVFLGVVFLWSIILLLHLIIQLGALFFLAHFVTLTRIILLADVVLLCGIVLQEVVLLFSRFLIQYGLDSTLGTGICLDVYLAIKRTDSLMDLAPIHILRFSEPTATFAL